MVHEWLVESHKLFARRSEYYTLLSTFVLIQALGLVFGFVAGCGVASRVEINQCVGCWRRLLDGVEVDATFQNAP